MEKLFHVRYWDYTGRLLSVNGHICLASVLCWGVMTILVVDVLQVQLEKAVLAVDEQIVTVAVFAVTPFVTGDLVTSFRAAIRLRDVLVYLEHAQEELEQLAERRRELEAALEERRQELETSLEERRQELERSVRESREHALAPIKDLTDKLAMLQEKTGRLTAESELLQKLHGRSIRGLLKRNPKAMSYSHREVFNDLKKRVAEKPEKTKKNLRK